VQSVSVVTTTGATNGGCAISFHYKPVPLHLQFGLLRWDEG
jgi:hypothetical protein